MLDRETIKKYDSYGDKTYIGAWVLEIIAASIGLSIALLMVVRGLEQGGWSAVISMAPMIGAAVMVAFAELTKIPLATLLLARDFPLIAKPLVLIALLLMAFITFETVFQGMEQAQTVRQIEYQEIVDDLAKVRSEIALLESGGALDRLTANRERLSTSLQSLEARLSSIEMQRQARKDFVLMNQLSSQVAAEYESLKSETEQLTQQLAEQQADFESWRDERQARYDEQKTAWEDQIKTYVNQGMRAEAQSIQRKLDNFAHPRTKSDWRTREVAFLRVESEANARLQQIRARSDEIMRAARTSPSVIAALNNVDQDFDQQRDQIQEQVKKAQEQLLTIQDEENAAVTDSLAANTKLNDLRIREQDLESERRKQAQLDQLRRIASSELFSGEKNMKPEDVGDAAVKSVGLIWFGSLSMLAALAGPITAIVALSLQSIAARARQKSREAMNTPNQMKSRTALEKLSKTIRSMIVHWRWRRIETRIQEREVTVPEFVYVPVPVDDPQELLRFLDNDLPDDVKAQVEGRVLGLKHALDATHAAESSPQSGVESVISQNEAPVPGLLDQNQVGDSGVGSDAMGSNQGKPSPQNDLKPSSDEQKTSGSGREPGDSV